jgi:hypothetical protein
MSRWVLLAFLLCPACAAGSPSPAPGGDKSISKVADPPKDPVEPVDPGPPADPDPPAGGGQGTSDPGASQQDPSDHHHLDCEALWEIAEHLGCSIVKLICAAVESLPVGSAAIPCDVAVPLACGLASAAADAAIALCPR